jgi:hypothetical protein
MLQLLIVVGRALALGLRGVVRQNQSRPFLSASATRPVRLC